MEDNATYVHNVLSEGVQADGGYLVPEEFERQIVTGLDEANVVRVLAKVKTGANTDDTVYNGRYQSVYQTPTTEPTEQGQG